MTCGYIVSDVQRNDRSITALLKVSGAPRLPHLGPDVTELSLSIAIEARDRLQVTIQDRVNRRWKVPDAVFPRRAPDIALDLADLQYVVDLVEENGDGDTLPRVQIVVKRRSDSVIIFQHDLQDLVFKEQYIEFVNTSVDQNANIYGLGENVSRFRKTNDGQRNSIINVNEMSQFLLNSNGMDIFLNPDGITYKVIGGVLEFYIMLGPEPLDVCRQYTDIVGKPAAMPYWTLGFHQCRWGYETLDDVKTVVQRYNEENIPLDCMWFDIDYMDEMKDFTYDPVKYPIKELQEFVESLHENHQHTVMIIDPGIKIDRSYRVYTEGLSRDAYIKNKNHEDFVGKVWPGRVVFPDYFNPECQDFWTKCLADWSLLANYDGIWLDMNELSNFCSGECQDDLESPNRPVTLADLKGETSENIGVALLKIAAKKRKTDVDQAGLERTTEIAVDVDTSINAMDNLNNPPYRINNAGTNENLFHMTTSMDAVHHGNITEYDAHNLYGHMQSLVTFQSCREIHPHKRPFILSRNTFAGSGKWTAHWLGDNASTFESMSFSIPGILSFQLFGVHLIGPDIGGFNSDAPEELLIRWMHLGAYYPFARNHNIKDAKPQEPYTSPTLAAASRQALEIRYRMLPYWYTLLWRGWTVGTPVLRPLCFEHPLDEETYGIDSQFFVGPGLIVSPALEPSQTQTKAYFPKGTYYSIHEISAPPLTGSRHHTLPTPLSSPTPAHYVAGTIIPLHHAAGLTTAATLTTGYDVVIALRPDAQAATGELYLDDGMSPPPNPAVLVHFSATSTGLSAVPEHVNEGYDLLSTAVLHDVVVLGLETRGKHVRATVDGRSLEVEVDGGCVKIKGIEKSFAERFEVDWTV
ncbi:alpha-glucosidase maltase [Geranomyces michiganensis]|nr:alpha-glucosidase maltase [Geranomyces michiganensis]